MDDSTPSFHTQILKVVVAIILFIVLIFIEILIFAVLFAIPYLLIFLTDYLIFFPFSIDGYDSNQFTTTSQVLSHFFFLYWVQRSDYIFHHPFLILYATSLITVMLYSSMSTSTNVFEQSTGANAAGYLHALILILSFPLIFILDPLISNNYPIDLTNILFSLDSLLGSLLTIVVFASLSYFIIYFSWRVAKHEIPLFWTIEKLEYSLAFVFASFLFIFLLTIPACSIIDVINSQPWSFSKNVVVDHCQQIFYHNPITTPMKISFIWYEFIDALIFWKENFSLVKAILSIAGFIVFVGGFAQGLKALQAIAKWLLSVLHKRNLNKDNP